MAEIKVQVISKIYNWLENTTAKVNILYGGAGAGKSYTLAQYILLDIIAKQVNKRILVTRKYNPSLRLSSIKLFKELLSIIPIPYEEHKAEQVFIFPNNNEIIFRGLDDPEKIKSMEFNYIWLEEATEFDIEDYQQLRLRLRKPSNIRNRMFLTFNPIGKHNWIYKHFFQQKQEDVNILHVNYKDNPFLDKEYIQILENLANEDRRFYEIYALGKFAELDNTIYNNWEVVTPHDLPNTFDEIIYGLDFGYNNPSACLKIGIRDKIIYVLDELYETGLTNQDLIRKLEKFVDNKTSIIYADSAEPDRIQEIKRAGFNIKPSDKNVKMGIDFVSRHKIKILNNCTNTITEIENYTWKKKDDEIIDEPVKYMDHAMDALRYAVYTHLGRQKEYKIKRL